jgi:hypothetical protein
VEAKPVTSPVDDDALPADTPERGELKIKERRSWRTWQLLTAVIVAAVLGMGINGDTGGSSSASDTSTTSGTLPPESTVKPDSGGASTTTTAPGAGGSTTTTAAGGSSGTTTTTAATGGGSTTTTSSTPGSTAAAGPAGVLLTSPQQTGNWTSPAFTTTAAGWNIGWAYRCAPAPATGPAFQVFIVPAGSSPTGTAAISETGASGQSVTSQSSLGSQTLVVQTTASCTWIVKVTGS